MSKLTPSGPNALIPLLGTFLLCFTSKAEAAVVESLSLLREGYPSRVRIDLRVERGYAPVSNKTHSYVLVNLHHDEQPSIDLKFILYTRISPRGPRGDLCKQRILGRVYAVRG
ncbi:hypothetical protein ARMGADRAFT_1075041 [Armillaria gallica]|uniref:Uncharacterized protein n=1 Tax=Armillaria gallica TaxID=47427 RepID=A0A2H3DWD2_ARMGA|nr:hypothetical protein ARMGADRAFT_1075041 [Armillaria gallica]